MKYSKILNNNSNQPFFISAEHASNKIPKKFGFLGLTKKDLVSNPDYYDIGSEEIARILAKDFKARCILSNFSRFFINLNRQINNPNLMPPMPFGMKIPRNLNVSKKEKKERLKYYSPYHNKIKKELDDLKKINKKVHYFCVHSFFPETPDGQKRNLDIGILYKYSKDASYCRKVKSFLDKKTNLSIKFNQPFSAHKTAGYTLNKYGKSKDITCIEFEINSKLLRNKKDIKKIGNLLSSALKQAIH